MSRAAAPIRITPALLAAAVALGALALSPSQATASCGDWLAGTGHEHQPMDAPQAPRPEGGQTPTPCRGPACGKAPAPPVGMAPAAGPSVHSDQWALIAAAELPRADRMRHGRPGDDRQPPAALRRPLERPPRFAA